MTKRKNGFTLIELMVVVLIAGLLMLAAAPFTRAWTDSAKITETKGILRQAVSRAKAAALRNGSGVESLFTFNNYASAAVCGASGSVDVYISSVDAGGTVTRASCAPAGTRIWGHALPNGIAIKDNVSSPSTTFAGLCLNNRGLIVTTCASRADLQITVTGSTDVQNVKFY